jgi:predicted chitinase/murein DD-endopeptidase MepM/ murein hydrolase activator NlpD
MTDADLNALLEQIRAQTEAIARLTTTIAGGSGDTSTLSKTITSSNKLQLRALDRIAKAQANSQKQLDSGINRMMSGVMKSMGQTSRSAQDAAIKAAEKKAGRPLSKAQTTAARQAGTDKYLQKLGVSSLAASAGLEALGRNALLLGKKLGAGEAGASDFAGAINDTVQSVTKYTKYLGKVGFVVSTVLSSLTKYGEAVAKQGDKQYRVFEQLQQSGAAATGGLTEVNAMLGKFGLSVDEAGKMLDLMAGNAQALVMFRGTVADGAKAMANIVDEVGNSGLRRELKLLGVSYEEQRQSMAAYITQQSRLGLAQTRDYKQMAQGAAEYMREQDAITRATSATRKQQEDAQNRAMAQEAFRTRINQMKRSSDPNERAQANRDLAAVKMIESEFGPEIATQMAALMSGFTTEVSMGIQKLTGAQAGTIAQRKDLTPEQQTDLLRDALRQGQQGIGETLGLTNNFLKETSIPLDKLSDALDRGPLTERMARARGAQGVLDKGAPGIPGMVDIDEANLKTKRAMQDFLQLGVIPVTTAMSKLAKITGYIAENLVPGKDSLKNLPHFADGGIARGPASGHLAMLHGTEAVIPLKGGKVPIDFGAGLSKLTGSSGSQATAAGGATDLNKTIVNMTKAMIPFTEALTTFTNTVKKKDIAGMGEGEEARKGEGIFDKMVSFIANLFDGGAAPGKADSRRGTSGGGTAGTPASPAAMAQEALAAHDHAHPHGEKGETLSPEAVKQISAGFVNPLKNMNQTSGMMRNDGKTYHGGIDLGGKIGDAIMAPISGKITRVLEAGKGDGGFGNAVEIEDSVTGMKHILAHMDKSMAKVGETVKAGTQIGTLGNTGQSTAPHLHHEIKDKFGKRIDPTQFYRGVKDARTGKAIPGAGSAFESTAGGAATGYPHMTPGGRAPTSAAITPMSGGVKDNLAIMTKALQEQGITDPKMINATLANVMKETGGKINVEEDLAGYANTSNERIRSIFGARAAKKSDEELNQIKKDPKQFAEMMYGKDSGMGLGNVEEGDAYKFRGRGAVGLTGRANYAAASKDLFGDDRLVQNPEMLKDPEMAAKTSAWFMKKNTGAMAKRMGMSGGPQTQQEADLLATSTIAGQAIKPGQGFLGKEALGKVSAYSAQIAGGQLPVGAVPPGAPGAPPMVAAATTGQPGMAAAPGASPMAAAQSPFQTLLSSLLGPIMGGGAAAPDQPAAPGSSFLSSLLGPELGSAIGGITSSLGGMASGTGAAGGIAGPVLPGQPAVGGGTGELVAAIKEQGQATTSAITSSMENLTAQLSGGGAAGGGSQVPELLTELIGAQRDQTAAINRLIQAQTA